MNWRMENIMRVRTYLPLALLLAPLAAPDAGAAGSDASFVLPFELIDNRVFVDVMLDGQGPFHVVLDTGASGSLTVRAAEQLKLKVQDQGETEGVGQKKVDYGLARVSSLQLGGLSLKDVAMNVMPFDGTDQVFGNKPVDGIIGLEIFQHRVVKIDYLHHQVTFTDPEKFVYAGKGDIVPFALPEQVPVIDATLDGIPGKFGVDTGARSALLLFGPFSANNKLAEKYHATLHGITGWGVGGPVYSLLARARELRMGNVVVRDPMARLSTQKTGLTAGSHLAGLIGPDVLSQFDVTFDYARKRIILEKNARYGQRDSYDRAGVWMGQEGDHFTAVDVITGGPGYEAGVRSGDIISAIDGVSTDTLDLADVRETMRRRPVGDHVRLTLETHGRRHDVVVTLRDLV